MYELLVTTSDCSPLLDALALQSKNSRLYPPRVIDWWKDRYNGPGEEQFEQNLVVKAVEHEQVVGFYALYHTEPRIVLSHLFVARDFQRRGIGSALLNAALDHSHCLGADTIELTSDPLAKDFYMAAGAEVVEVLDEMSSYPTYAMIVDTKLFL